LMKIEIIFLWDKKITIRKNQVAKFILLI